MRTIFAEYNPGRNSIDVYTSVHWSMKKKRAMTNLQTGQKVRWNTSWEKIR